MPTRLTQSVRGLGRLQRIARVLTQQGFGHVVDRLDLGRFVPLWLRGRSKRKIEDDPAAGSLGRRLCQVATDLGPIYVKLGQMLATRPDIVPPEILAELRSLQDRVEPFDSERAHAIIRDELKTDVSRAYASLDETPIASGSIGQVYRGKLPDGQNVVVKVRRPGIENTVRGDLQVLRWLAEGLERRVAESRPYRPRVLVEEFERAIINELDLINEAAVTARFHEAFAEDDQVVVPDVIWSHTTSRVLTLQAIDGDHLEDVLNRNGLGIHRKELANRLTDIYLRQFFELGIFHADPHPGNLLVLSPSRIGLIDFGQVGTLSDATSGQLLVLLFGVLTRNVELIADTLIDMGAAGTSGQTDRQFLARDLQVLLGKYQGRPLKRFNLTTLYGELTDVVRQHDLIIPRDVVLMLKTLATVWGTALRLDPDLDIQSTLRPRLLRMARDRFSPSRVARSAGLAGWHVLSLLKTAPQQLREMLRQVSSGKWQVHVRHENLEPLAKEVDRSGNRLAFSIVIAAVVIGSSMVVSSSTDVELFGVKLQTYGVIGYLIAGVLGVGLLVAILRSGRLS